MANISGMAGGPILDAYDFSGAAVIADIGGAYGALIAAVVNKHADARGILFDLPNIVEKAAAVLGDAAQRVECVPGDFLNDTLPGADLYLLKHILHDWDDEHCVTILKGVRAAMNPGAKVAVIEFVIPDPLVPGPATLMDLNMMVMLDGMERTAIEYGALFERAGLKLTRTIPTKSPFVIIVSA